VEAENGARQRQAKQDQLQVWFCYALAHFSPHSMPDQAGSAPGVVLLRACTFFNQSVRPGGDQPQVLFCYEQGHFSYILCQAVKLRGTSSMCGFVTRMRIFHSFYSMSGQAGSAPGVVLLRACAFFTSFYASPSRISSRCGFVTRMCFFHSINVGPSETNSRCCYAHVHFSLILCQTKQDQLQVWFWYAHAKFYSIYVRPSGTNSR
jgi:hypothetical protein